jgi:hypothetical protein
VVVDSVAAIVEALLDAIAATIRAIRGVGPNLTRAEQQGHSDQQRIPFHISSSSRTKCVELTVDNGARAGALTRGPPIVRLCQATLECRNNESR